MFVVTNTNVSLNSRFQKVLHRNSEPWYIHNGYGLHWPKTRPVIVYADLPSSVPFGNTSSSPTAPYSLFSVFSPIFPCFHNQHTPGRRQVYICNLERRSSGTRDRPSSHRDRREGYPLTISRISRVRTSCGIFPWSSQCHLPQRVWGVWTLGVCCS